MQVLGLFCNESAKYTQRCPTRARKPLPQSSALRLCRPPLRSALSTCRFAHVPSVGIPLSLHLLPPAFARRRSACMYKPPPDLRAKSSTTAQGGSNHEHHRGSRRSVDTEQQAAEADRERSNRGQHTSPHRTVGARTLRSPHRLPHRNGQVSQLQLWQHSGDCTAKAGRNPRGRPLRVESAWPQGQEGRAWHPHSRSRDRGSPEEGRRGRERRRNSEAGRLGWVPCRVRV